MTQKRRPARPKDAGKQGLHRPAPSRRPKGSKNTPKAEVPLTPEPLAPHRHARALWQVIAEVISLTYLVLDGHFGNHHALQMAPQRNLHLNPSCDAMPLCTSLTSAPMPGGGPIANMAARWSTTPYQWAIPQRDYGGGTHPDPPVPGATAPQRVHTAVECRHPCQDQPAHPGPCLCHPVQQ